jgi:hypothetical protein
MPSPSMLLFLGNDKKEHIDALVCLEALSGKEVAVVFDNY